MAPPPAAAGPAIRPAARRAAAVGGPVGEAIGGFAGGFGHGFKHGLLAGSERYNTGALGRAAVGGIRGYDRAIAGGRKAIEAAPEGSDGGEHPKAIEGAPADRGGAEQRRLRVDPYQIHDLGRAGSGPAEEQHSAIPMPGRPAEPAAHGSAIPMPGRAPTPAAGGTAPPSMAGGALMPMNRASSPARRPNLSEGIIAHASDLAYPGMSSLSHSAPRALAAGASHPGSGSGGPSAGPSGAGGTFGRQSASSSTSLVPYSSNTSSSAGAASVWRLPAGHVMPYSAATSKSTFQPTLF